MAILKAQLVGLTEKATWITTLDLPITPFPGLGIRLDVYDVFNVESVVVLDPGFDVTCIGRLEGIQGDAEKKYAALGFEVAPYP